MQNFSAPPKWETLPVDVLTNSGESVTVKCTASGSPKPEITWKKIGGMEKIFYLRVIISNLQNILCNLISLK